jgi:hypothetical protein
MLRRHVPSIVMGKSLTEQALLNVKRQADSLAMQDVSMHRLGHGRRD